MSIKLAAENISLSISKFFLDEIIAHARRDYPQECCGILAGRKGEIIRVYPMENMEKSSSTYFMNPEEQYQVFQEIDREGLELLAIYHSHPHALAYPSARDIELAFYPDVLMMIISLLDFQNPFVAVFEVKEGKVKKANLIFQKKEDF